jgi:S1-C subfamily serine protease
MKSEQHEDAIRKDTDRSSESFSWNTIASDIYNGVKAHPVESTAAVAAVAASAIIGKRFLGSTIEIVGSRFSKTALSSELNQIAHNSLFTVSTGYSRGSGFALRSDGLIGTAFHVTEDAPIHTLSNLSGLRFTARPIAALPGPDVAILKADSQVQLESIKLGSQLLEGKTKVVSMGMPGEKLSIFTGAVSRDRTAIMPPELYKTETGRFLPNSPATYLSGVKIAPGMSGGPLLNAQNEVVGSATGKAMYTFRTYVATEVSHMSRLLQLVERAERSGGGVTLEEAAKKLSLSQRQVLDRLHTAQLDGFLVPKATPKGQVWNWKVLLDS